MSKFCECFWIGGSTNKTFGPLTVLYLRDRNYIPNDSGKSIKMMELFHWFFEKMFGGNCRTRYTPVLRLWSFL